MVDAKDQESTEKEVNSTTVNETKANSTATKESAEAAAEDKPAAEAVAEDKPAAESTKEQDAKDSILNTVDANVEEIGKMPADTPGDHVGDL